MNKTWAIYLALVAVYGLYTGWTTLSADYAPALARAYSNGQYLVPYFHRVLQSAAVLFLLNSVVLLGAAMQAWRSSRWQRTVALVCAVDVLIAVTVLLLIGTEQFGRSAYAAVGLIGSMVLLQLILLAPVALRQVMRRLFAKANRQSAMLIFALALYATAPVLLAQQRCSTDRDCAAGEVCRAGESHVVTECFLWIFCDTYTVHSLVCAAAEPPPDDSSREQVFLICAIPSGSTDGVFVVVRDFTCQLVFRIVDRLIDL